jgi:hypothetical protein
MEYTIKKHTFFTKSYKNNAYYSSINQAPNIVFFRIKFFLCAAEVDTYSVSFIRPQKAGVYVLIR